MAAPRRHEDDGLRAAERRRLAATLAAGGSPAREREILRLRFEEGLTQSEIAERVGVSQMHVSRLMRDALRELRQPPRAIYQARA